MKSSWNLDIRPRLGVPPSRKPAGIAPENSRTFARAVTSAGTPPTARPPSKRSKPLRGAFEGRYQGTVGPDVIDDTAQARSVTFSLKRAQRSGKTVWFVPLLRA